jgi:hypothetical protein
VQQDSNWDSFGAAPGVANGTATAPASAKPELVYPEAVHSSRQDHQGTVTLDETGQDTWTLVSLKRDEDKISAPDFLNIRIRL